MGIQTYLCGQFLRRIFPGPRAFSYTICPSYISLQTMPPWHFSYWKFPPKTPCCYCGCSVVSFFSFFFYFSTKFCSCYPRMETSTIDLKFNTICRLVSVHGRAFLFENLTADTPCKTVVWPLKTGRDVNTLQWCSLHIGVVCLTASPRPADSQVQSHLSNADSLPHGKP